MEFLFCVIEQDTLSASCSIVLVQSRKTGNPPDMTEKLLTGLQSSYKDFENRSKNAVCQKYLEFYHTFLLALFKKLESESKSWS